MVRLELHTHPENLLMKIIPAYLMKINPAYLMTIIPTYLMMIIQSSSGKLG
jgi:hypothetical protein